jgi:hypothetical protein
MPRTSSNYEHVTLDTWVAQNELDKLWVRTWVVYNPQEERAFAATSSRDAFSAMKQSAVASRQSCDNVSFALCPFQNFRPRCKASAHRFVSH